MIDQLDVDEDERPVTVIVMANTAKNGLSQYLLHLIAGHLSEPIVKPVDDLWNEIQTHYVGNDSLYEEIVQKCDEGLKNLKPEKKEILVKEGAPFVMTTRFPVVNINGNYEISQVIPAKVQELTEDGRETYLFETESDLHMLLHEPRSPPKIECSNRDARASGSFNVEVW